MAEDQILRTINDRLMAISSDTKEIKENDIPSIITHLARINGTIAQHDKAIASLEVKFESLPCSEMRTSMELLAAEQKRMSRNWSSTINVVITLLQAVLNAVVLYYVMQIIAGK